MDVRQSQLDLDQRTLKFVVGSVNGLREGDTLIVRRISKGVDGLQVEVVPENVVKETVARLLS